MHATFLAGVLVVARRYGYTAAGLDWRWPPFPTPATVRGSSGSGSVCSRAGNLLGLNVEDLDLGNKQAVIVAKDGKAERIFWSSVTARLLPRLVGRRTAGPLFLSDLPPHGPGPGRHRPLSPHRAGQAV